MPFFYTVQDKPNFQKLIEAIKGSKNGKVVGVFAKDSFLGPFMTAWKGVLDAAKFETVSYIYIDLFMLFIVYHVFFMLGVLLFKVQ